jgi:hypothetical protein
MAGSILGTPQNLNLGDSYTAEAGSNRLVVLVPLVSNTGAAATITAMSMGGVAAEEAVQYCELGSEWGMEGIYFIREANIPSGAQVLAGTTSAGTLLDVACYTLNGMDQTNPVRAGMFSSMEAISTNPAVVNLTGATAGDVCIIGGHGAQALQFSAYTNGYTEDVRDQQASAVWISASKVLVGGDTNDDCSMAAGGTSGRKSCCWAVFAQASGSSSDTPLAVDSADIVIEQQNVTLISDVAYTLPVTTQECPLEGQEVPFQLTNVGQEGELVGIGQAIEHDYSIGVIVGSGVISSEEIASDETTHITLTIDVGFGVIERQTIVLSGTGLPDPPAKMWFSLYASLWQELYQ